MDWLEEQMMNLSKLESKVKRYEKALFALLDFAYEADQDISADIITDTLGGFELMEQFEENAVRGEKEFLEHFHKED